MICVSHRTNQIIFEATLCLKTEVGGPFEKHETIVKKHDDQKKRWKSINSTKAGE